MHGSRTPEEQEREFRKHYIVTGNVAASARAVGLPVSTGYEARNRALDDPEFVKARDRIRERFEPEVEQMAVCALQICMERLSASDERLDKLLTAAEGASRVSMQDPGPAYAASFAKVWQALVGAKRLTAEKSGEIIAERSVVIKVTGPAVADGDGRAA